MRHTGMPCPEPPIHAALKPAIRDNLRDMHRC